MVLHLILVDMSRHISINEALWMILMFE